jgi:uncharacterized caspase-like protein
MCYATRSTFLAILSLLVVFTIGVAPTAARAERRVALVVGNAAYPAGTVKTAANDAGLIAQTLEAAGFEVMGARDLDQDALRRAFRDFLDKAGALRSEDVAVVYLSGYGLQLEGENYFVPLDARMERASDIPVQAIRLSDYTRALAALKLKVSIVVLDLARNYPFTLQGAPLAGGLALVEPEPGMLIAFNAAPGTIASAAEGAYAPYAKALAEMIREGGLPLEDLFDRVRLRVSDATQGAQVPWHASDAAASFVFFERTADASPPVAASELTPGLRLRAIRDLGATEAYIAAVERDTLQDYLEFLDSYASNPLAKRVRAVVAVRREALIWRRTRLLDTPAAYWAYLRLYSEGPHAGDCYRRLAFLHASLEPPPDFSAIPYDIPPPPSEETTYLQQPAIFLGDPTYDFAPPPPIPESFLPPPSPEFAELAPPELPQTAFLLPAPVYIPVPVWVRPPHHVQAPTANNVIFANLHNRVVTNRAANTFTVTDQEGRTRTLPPPPLLRAGDRQPGRGAQLRDLPTSNNVGPALPPSVAELAAARVDSTNRLRRERLERAQRDERPGLPLPSSIEPALSRAPSQSAAAPRQLPSFWEDRQQRHVSGGNPPQPLAPAAHPERPMQPAGALPKVVPPSGVQAAPTGWPQQFDLQRAERRQQQQPGQPAQRDQAPARQQQQAAPVAAAGQQQQAAPLAAAGQQQQAPPPAAAPQQQQAAQAAAARQQHQAAAAGQQQQAAQAAAAGQQQQAAQAAAARQQQQAAQAAAAARKQQAAQAAEAAGQQQATPAAAARQQQQAAPPAATPQQQQASQAAAARQQQQAAQAAAAARQQQQAAQAAAAARQQQQAAQAAAAARQQQQAAQAASAARQQQQAAQAAAAARQQQQAAQAAAAARASAAVAAARAQHVPAQRR